MNETVFFEVDGEQTPTEATRTLLQKARDVGCHLYVCKSGGLAVRANKGVLTEHRQEKIQREAGAIVALLKEES